VFTQDSFLSTFGTRKGLPAFFISNVRLTDVKDKPFCVAVRLVTAPTLDHRRRVGHIHMSFEGDFSWEGFGAALAEKGVFAPRVTVFDGHVLLKSLLSSEDCGTGGTHEGREVLLVVVTLEDVHSEFFVVARHVHHLQTLAAHPTVKFRVTLLKV